MDIEILIDYLQKKGYRVWVYAEMLLIEKMVEGQICSLAWAISKIQLQQTPDFLLFHEADRRIREIEKAIHDRSLV